MKKAMRLNKETICRLDATTLAGRAAGGIIPPSDGDICPSTPVQCNSQGAVCRSYQICPLPDQAAFVAVD